MQTGELCVREVVLASPHDTAREAAERMIARHVGSLVVVEGPAEARRPVGMLTDRDLLRAVVVESVGHARALEVGDLMTRDVVTAREDDGVFEALESMRDAGVRRLPVVDDAGRLVGILAYDDLLEWVAESVGALGKLVTTEQRHERERR